MVLVREITAVLLILRGDGELPLVAAARCWAQSATTEVRYTYPNNAEGLKTDGFYSEPAKEWWFPALSEDTYHPGVCPITFRNTWTKALGLL